MLDTNQSLNVKASNLLVEFGKKQGKKLELDSLYYTYVDVSNCSKNSVYRLGFDYGKWVTLDNHA